MAFSVLTKRSKPQDSPTFWLSLVAGSLLLHLVLLLLGRWYFSQAASAPAGLTQAPLDFVEIDPNAPPLKQAKPIAPSNTQTQAELPKTAPPQESVAETTQAPNSIANLPRQTPERSQPRTAPSPSPSPTTPINQPNRSQPTPPSGQLPSDRTTPRQNPTAPSTPDRGGTNPSSPGASTPGATTPGASPGTTTPGASTPETTTPSPSPTQSPDSNGTTSGTTGPTGGNSTGPISGGTPLAREANVQGLINGALQEDTFRPEQYARGTVTLKSAELSPIKIEDSSQLAEKVLDLRLGLSINSEGQVVDTDVRDDSPTLMRNPKFSDPDSAEAQQARAEIKQIVEQLVFQANADGSLAFDVNLESKGANAYRIINVRVTVEPLTSNAPTP
ncbi:hypothetical protein LEP3755_23600 [Leptolyngbya sp. NIES-3755]|nr:hypothetical protein LEP3755_23600 [Leptolyngbya sp. NIES-3755]